jgi:AcrR family transcriptional regulator
LSKGDLGVKQVSTASRAPRADARRNQALVLEAAIAAFATEGLSVPIHEIARRAGVGTGTVSRHFPTKEALYIAIVRARIESVVERGRDLAAAKDPGAAFFEFFSMTVTEFAANLGLADALAGAGFDMHAVASGAKYDVLGVLGDLLARAQKAGAVRKGITVDDAKALMVACCRGPQSADPRARHRMVEVISQGLRPTRK